MRIYISVDMEGIGGICLPQQVEVGTGGERGKELYQEGRLLMVEEVNAAIEAAHGSGADTILVADRHDTGFNLPLERLSSHARYVMGYGPRALRFPFLDATFDGMILLGYHAMVGTESAVLDHTWDAAVYHSCSLNGAAFGEIAMDGLICGAVGVPVILVTGDDKACEEARRTFGKVSTCEVKKAIGRHSALMMDPRSARARIQQSVKDAMASIREFAPYRITAPYVATITYKATSYVDGRHLDGVKAVRLDANTVQYVSDDIRELFTRVF